ncbi:hypothetical protein [Haloprofundus salilacus]|uniref:hypothetical protein n=1 Tax=Haloprofundus salilacus TaxID=2876190 RepID=UPI001CCECFB4|nr:hypothetical protein [Haloprofundus salilacus]
MSDVPPETSTRRESGEPPVTSTTSKPPDSTSPRESMSGYGLTLTLVGAVLLALAYYGVIAVEATRDLGRALPEPFYFLAISFLFVLELLKRRELSALTLARSIAFTAVYGTLFVFAAEGSAYLWDNPGVAVGDFAGVTVLAVALVASALAYVGYLTVVKSWQ